MKETAHLFLERRLGRRAFVSRLTRLGISTPAAGSLALSLKQGSAEAGTAARTVRNRTGGEVMAEFLREWNVRYIFGLGGSEEVGFLDALVDRLDLHYTLGLHEGSVLSMADGYARASGRTAFVNLHSVAGAAYALGPMVNAFKDRTPLVVTVGRQSRDIRGQNAFLEAVNLHQLPRDYSKWQWDVMQAGTIPEVLRRAFLLSRLPPAGPAFVTFSKDLWEAPVERAELTPPARSRIEMEIRPDPQVVTRSVDFLLEARFPVVVAGREMAACGGARELVEIAERLGLAVFTDIPASHSPIVFPTTHPLYCGLFTEDPAYPRGFDLFWSMGGTMFTQFFQPPEPLVPRQARTIHLGMDAGSLGRNYPVDLAGVTHPRQALKAILEELASRSLPSSRVADRRKRIEDYHAARRKRLEERAGAAWDHKPISGERLALELNRRMDAGAIVVSELATADKFLWEYLDFNQADPGRRHITSSGGCLGWGVGAAIGARIARPDRQVVLLVGDGSFNFGVQGLWSAARYQVPVAFIIWNNRSYQANRRALHRYGGRAAATGKYIGCYLAHPEIRHTELARGYGVEGESVEDPGLLPAALDRCFAALASGRPYLLDVVVEPLFGGADSTWYDFFSVARKIPRQT